MRFLTVEIIQKDLSQYSTLEEFHEFAESHGLSYWDIKNLTDFYCGLLKNTPVNFKVELPVFEGDGEPPKPSIEVLV
jgi:hypothetical protein